MFPSTIHSYSHQIDTMNFLNNKSIIILTIEHFIHMIECMNTVRKSKLWFFMAAILKIGHNNHQGCPRLKWIIPMILSFKYEHFGVSHIYLLTTYVRFYFYAPLVYELFRNGGVKNSAHQILRYTISKSFIYHL